MDVILRRPPVPVRDTIADADELTTTYVRPGGKASDQDTVRPQHATPPRAGPESAGGAEMFGGAAQELNTALDKRFPVAPAAKDLHRTRLCAPRVGGNQREQRFSSPPLRAAPLSNVAPPNRRWIRYAVGLLLVTALVNVGLWLSDSSNGVASRVARVTSATRHMGTTLKQRFSKTRAPGPGQSAHRRIYLSVAAEPPEAQLYLDGRLTSNPIRIAYPADESPHELRAEAAGYVTRVQTVRFDRDIFVVQVLVPTPTAQTALSQ